MVPTTEDTDQGGVKNAGDEEIKEEGIDTSMVPYIPTLKSILGVIEVNVWIDTNDRSKARLIVDGFRYLMQVEFQRQQPLLALFYELEFANPSLKPGGSFYYKDKIIFKLKAEGEQLKNQLDQVRKELKESKEATGKQVRAAVLGVIIGLSPILKPITEALIEYTSHPPHSQVENQLNRDNAPTIIKVELEHREVNNTDIFPKGGSWDL